MRFAACVIFFEGRQKCLLCFRALAHRRISASQARINNVARCAQLRCLLESVERFFKFSLLIKFVSFYQFKRWTAPLDEFCFCSPPNRFDVASWHLYFSIRHFNGIKLVILFDNRSFEERTIGERNNLSLGVP